MRRLCLALALLLGVAPLRAVTITILHTSDLHGRVHPHDALADEDLGEGLARVATAVRSIRADGNPTLLLDSGDTIQGAPEQALAFAARGDASDPIVRAMNLVGYDAMAVGNHEFDFGLARLEKSARQARFPFLSANVTDAYDATLFPQYAILEAGGVRVGVIGFVTPHVPNWESPRLIEGLQFGDPVAVARRLVPSLRNQDRCDVIVILTHQGFERDPATGEERGSDRGENQAYALATEVPGVDFVLAGHAHAVVAPRQITGTWVSEPGRWGNTLTRYDVTLEKAGARWKITDVQGRNLHMKNVPPDPAVAAVIAPEHDAAMRALGEELAVLDDAGLGAGGEVPRHGPARLAPLGPALGREGAALVRLAPAGPARGLAGRPAHAAPGLGLLSLREQPRDRRGDGPAGARGSRALGRLRRAAPPSSAATATRSPAPSTSSTFRARRDRASCR